MGKDTKMWDNGRRNIEFDQAEFIDMGSLIKNSAFNDICSSGS